MADDVRVTILLSEQLYEDRGKLSLLGTGWTQIKPGQRTISFVSIVDLVPPDEAVSIELEFALHKRSDEDILAGAKLELEAETPPDDAVVPAFAQIVAPIRWSLELEPDTIYLIDVRYGTEILTTATFVTNESPQPPAELDPETGPA